MPNKEYRCMKCEGKNVEHHGRYCPEGKKEKLPKANHIQEECLTRKEGMGIKQLFPVNAPLVIFKNEKK